MLRIVVWALALMVVSVPAGASSPSLTPAQILALVTSTPQLKIDRHVPPLSGFDAKTHPYVDVVGASEGSVGGYLGVDDAHQGTLTSGYDVLAVPLDSGGSGGVFNQIVFARRGHGSFAYAGHIDSAGHVDVEVKNGKIVATLPYYAAKDPNCCPSKLIVQIYAIRNNKLARASQRMIPTPKPSP
jgi:hypothetical protein